MAQSIECPKCLNDCSLSQKYCPRCGTELGEDAFHIPDASRIFKTEPLPQEQLSKPHGTVLMFVTLILCILGATALIGIFLAIRGLKTASNPREKNIYKISLVLAIINITLMVILMIFKQ
jgi:predicted nucleic acid-binding Zn ribbon protein